jgi:hypothetical protein
LRVDGFFVLQESPSSVVADAASTVVPNVCRAVARLPLLIAGAHHPEGERRVSVSELLHQVGRVLADRDQDRGERVRSF